jgi:hypothetical protein
VVQEAQMGSSEGGGCNTLPFFEGDGVVHEAARGES